MTRRGLDTLTLRGRVLVALAGVTVITTGLLSLMLFALLPRLGQTPESIRLAVVTLGTFASVSLALHVWTLDRLAMRRLRTANDTISRIAHSGDLSIRIPPMGTLADDFNSMMEELQRATLERGELQERLRQQAFHDALTGLANRRLFMDELAATVQRGETGFALVFLDLDDFKVVNDTLGHVDGDAVLAEVGKRLAGEAQPGDVVARLGGDEFVLLLRSVRADRAERCAAELADVIRRPMWIRERLVSLSASYGMAVNSGPGASADELLRQADAVLYRAKRSSRTSSMILDADLPALGITEGPG